jgi:prepilin-type N-terminal cleavage/methylation domain-containing protein
LEGGFTLIELLLVMSLLGLILGAGVGVLASLDVESDTAPERVRAGLLSAQAAALAERLPANLQLSADGRNLLVSVPRPRATWHFEAAGDGLALRGAALLEDGYLGRCLDLQRPTLDASAEVDLLGRAELADIPGFALRFHLRWSGSGGGELLSAGENLSLRLEEDGRLNLHLAAMGFGSRGERAALGSWSLKSPPDVLTRGRWQQLTLLADGGALELWLDGVRVASTPLELDGPRAEPYLPEGRLVLGGRPRPFPGQIDELGLYAFERSDPLPLPREVEWPADAPRRLRFGVDGLLESARQKPVQLRLGLPGGVERTLILSSRGISDG